MNLVDLRSEVIKIISNITGSRLIFLLDDGSNYIPKISKVDPTSLKKALLLVS